MTPRDRPGRVLLVEDSEGGAQLMRIAFGERLPDAVLEVYTAARPPSRTSAAAAWPSGTLGRYWLKVVSLPNSGCR